MSPLNILLSRRMLVVLLMGFASGLPLALIGGTLQAWMTEAGVDIKVVTLSALAGIPFTYKFIWAPAMDRFQISPLGLRRGWLIASQIGLCALILCLAYSDPAISMRVVALVSLTLAFFGATQDIVIDAYRTEILREDERALGASLAILGYRVAMIVSGGLALIMAQHLPWPKVYAIMSLIMAANVLVSFAAPEPTRAASGRKTFWSVAKASLGDFLKRRGAFEILLFVLLYKLPDVLAAAPTTPFLLKTGFSKEEIGWAAKSFGLAATISGAFIGGLLIPRLGLFRSLIIFGLLQAVSILSFSMLAVHPSLGLMVGSVAFENLCNGMGTAAFTAFLMNQCRREYTAGQYALLTSFMSLNRYVGGSLSGALAEAVGWPAFFMICVASAVPGMALLSRYSKWEKVSTE